MKIHKIKIILSGVLLFLFMTACENAPIVFDDFGKTACYFPYQTPVRTLILGKYDEGFNDNDNLRQFEIGVIMSGVYENKIDRKVYFELDTVMLSNVLNVKYLPTSYYTVETTSPVVIPKGDTKGRILIKLTDAFFNDPKAIAAVNISNYAIPLKITNKEGLDSILVGKPLVINPNRNIATDWSILPKDYTLFGIKYINKYHGNYLRRGADKVTNPTLPTNTGTTIYHTVYAEKNEVVKASTFDMNTVTVPNPTRRFGAPNGVAINLNLVFAADGSCKVYNKLDLVNSIGTGTFVENSDTWGGKLHDAIYLNFSFTDLVKNETHVVTDTLVIRDRGVVFETFVPTLKP